MANENDNVVGKNEKKLTKDTPANVGAPVSDTVTLVHKRNWSHELRIGNNYIPFGAYGRAEVPRSIIEHPDFDSEKSNFTVKE